MKIHAASPTCFAASTGGIGRMWARAGLGIRTSADIFDASRVEHDARSGRNVAQARLGIPTPADVSRGLRQEDEEAGADGRSHRWLARKPGGSFVRETSVVRASLRTVGRRWGRDVVQHYQWASRGARFCTLLRKAALAVPDRTEAITKLNRLMLRRHQTPGQRVIEDCASPVSQIDLERLAAWDKTGAFTWSDRGSVGLPYRPVAAQDLPDGFGFDKFGLLVRTAYAVDLVEPDVDAAEPLRPAALDEVGQTDRVMDTTNEGMDGILAGESAEVGEDDSETASVRDAAGRSLKTVGRIWGRDKVQYYQWANRGVGFCSKLLTAAREVRDWDEAVVKLNRLLHRRAQQVRRRNVSESVNPIEPDDLANLKAWSHKDSYVRKNDRDGIALPFRKLAGTELLAGFGFDKFGLLMRKEQQQPRSVPEGGVDVEVRNRQNMSHKGDGQAGADKKRQLVKGRRREKDASASKPVARPGDLFGGIGAARNRPEKAKAETYRDACDRENLTSAGPGIQPSADLLWAVPIGPDWSRMEERRRAQSWGDSVSGVTMTEGVEDRGRQYPGHQQLSGDAENRANVADGAARPGNEPRRPKKRRDPSSTGQPQSKRARTAPRPERSDDEQMRDLASVMRSLDEEFAEKERLSHAGAWCAAIPDSRKVSTVQEFYKAFHDKRTLPIHTCTVCYRKCARTELEDIGWDQWTASPIAKSEGSPFQCRACFLEFMGFAREFGTYPVLSSFGILWQDRQSEMRRWARVRLLRCMGNCLR